MNERVMRDDLAAAVRAEHEAYQMMRLLIPDLDLPAVQRAPLNRRQEIAVSDYNHARRRLRTARALDAGGPSSSAAAAAPGPLVTARKSLPTANVANPRGHSS